MASLYAGSEKIRHIGRRGRCAWIDLDSQGVEHCAQRVLMLVIRFRDGVRDHLRPDDRKVHRRVAALIGSTAAFVEGHKCQTICSLLKRWSVEDGAEILLEELIR